MIMWLIISIIMLANNLIIVYTEMSSGNRIFSLTEEQEESILDISSASSISSMNANRRRSKCNYDGIDILQTMNRHSIEFDQSVYIVNDLLVNTSVESSLFEFSVVYRGALLYSNDASIRYPTVDTNRPQTKSVLYNISSSDDTFELKHLHSIGSKVFYSLVLKRPLHYFVNPQHRYQFKLMAYSPNQPSLYSRAWVQISLRNFNCHSPAFISGNQFSVSEIASPNHIVGVVHAVDEDDDKVFYSQKNLFEKYKVDDKSGVITVLTKPLLSKTDRFIKFHELIVDAVDDSSSCASSGLHCPSRKNETVIKIKISDVNMYAPTFTSPICGKSIEIMEHMDISHPITTLSATDLDRDENGKIEFFFPDTSSKNNAYQKFRLEAHDQQSSVRNVSIFATETFDYDAPQAVNTFFLLVFAQDSGRQRRQGFCFLKISITDKNDNNPIFVVHRWNYQLRNTSHLIDVGRRLFRVIASDKDSGENGRVQYFLVGNNKYFDVEQDTGFIKFKYSNIDNSHFPQHFEVYAKDCGIQSRRSKQNAEVVITLSGSDDAELEWVEDKFNDFTVNISEKYHSKYALANIKDNDFNGNISFIGYGRITNPRFHLSPRPEDTLFVASKTILVGAISDVGGTMYTSGIRVTNELDAEVKDRHYLYLRVEDLRGLQSLVGLCKVFVHDENDQIPFFDTSELKISLLEGNWSDYKIGQVQAFDQDRTYPNNYVRYRLRHGESSAIRDMFSVKETGEIVAHGYFDREKQSSWNFYVESYDGKNGYGLNEPNTDSVAIRVEIIDVNDNSPHFTEKSIQVTISELFEIGKTIIQLTCEDPDYDSSLQFYIVGGNNEGHFGIRHSARQSSGILHTAELFVAGRLDFLVYNTYELLVLATDSLNFDEISVKVSLTQANCRAPKFTDIYKANVVENVAAHDLVVVNAHNQDFVSSDFLVRSSHHPVINRAKILTYSILDPNSYPDFKLTENRLSITRGLDRDQPSGRSFWIVPIRVSDGSLFTFTNVNVTIEDVNDNGPFVVKESPFILMEEQRKPAFRFRLDDFDEWPLGHGGPFKLPTVVASTLHSYRNFAVSYIPNSHRSSPIYLLVYNGGRLDREHSKKEFMLTLNIKDAEGVGGRFNIPVIIGDRNDNGQQDGVKSIEVHRYLVHTKCISPAYIGDVFVEDFDDWDRTEKTFTSLPENRFFDVDSSGRININEKAARFIEQGEYEFKIDVFDRMFGTSVTGIVDVSINDITERDTRNAVHIRLSGFTSRLFVEKKSPGAVSYLEMLKGNLTAMLGVKYTNVLILNVKDHSDDMIDVYLVIRGLGRYLVEQRIRQTTYLQRIFRIHSVSPNLCKINKADVDICPSNTFCFTTRLVNSVKTNLVDTNRSSLVALDVMDVADCVCSDYFDLSSKRQRQQCVSSGGWCRNGGSCKDDGYGGFMCECPFGFEGPRCESLERTFAKNGFAKFKALDSCQPSRLHLEFSSLSEAKAGLLLLNGDPFMDQESDKFFIAIQIVNGSVLVHLGRNTMVQLGDDMVDGNWHHVDIEQVGEIAKVTLDQCESSVVHVNLLSRNLAQNDSDIGENQDNALYLGGLPQRLRVQDVFRHVLAVHEFEGCLRNVMINGQFLDLFIPQNLEGLQHKDSYAGQCPCRHHIYCDVSLMPRALVPSVPWWIWILILAVIFIMTASLSVTLLSFIRRRNDMFLKRCYSAIDKGDDLDSDDHGLRENLISYGEGAGEQDQTSFDINILKKPIDLKTVARQSPKVHEDKSDNGTDSFIPYAYEGENNSCAASELSSITYSSEQLAPLLHQPLHCNHRNTLEKLAELFDPGSDGDSDSCRSSSLCCISQPIVQQANLKNHVSRQMCNGNTTFSPTSSVHFESDI